MEDYKSKGYRMEDYKRKKLRDWGTIGAKAKR
jgi:hypothetical protein